MSAAPIDDILRHLAALVAVDTQNPPRNVSPDGQLAAVLHDALPGFEIAVTDLGDGCLIFDAQRGAPRVLFNVHMDTVPIAEGWTLPPHDLHVTEDKAFGLGACDIKGAAAVLFALASRTDAPMRIVLSTDEEAGSSRCIKAFVADPPDVDLAVVAEPTSGRPVLRHRGIMSNEVTFSGTSGHTSGGASASAVHQAVAWSKAVIDHPEAADNRLNIGRIEGGVKPNMVAASALLRFGFRPAPGTDHHELLDRFLSATPESTAELTPRFVGPALPSDSDGKAATAQTAAARMIEDIGLTPADPVDFWTEASLFAAAGVPATVLGPGHIAQAHTADEFVPLSDLAKVYDVYEQIVHYRT